MPKYHDYTLSEEELKQVRAAMKSTKAKEAKRANVLYNLHLGYKPQEVATMFAISMTTVYNYFNRFKDKSGFGLENKPIPGRPPKADSTYRQRLLEVIESDPSEFGLGFSIWTLPSLQAFLKRETGVAMSQNRISEILQEESYVYRRPKKDLGHRQDADLREEVEAALDAVKKTPKRGISSYSLWMKVDTV